MFQSTTPRHLRSIFALGLVLLLGASGCATRARAIAPEKMGAIKKMAVVAQAGKTAHVVESHFRVLTNVTVANKIPVVGWDFARAFQDRAYAILAEETLPFELVKDEELYAMTFPLVRDDKGAVLRRDYSRAKEKGIDTVLEFSMPAEAGMTYGYYKYSTTGWVPCIGAKVALVNTANGEVLGEAFVSEATEGIGTFYGLSIDAASFDELEKDGLRLFKQGLMARADQIIRQGIQNVGLVSKKK